jgi:hypothetical protein
MLESRERALQVGTATPNHWAFFILPPPTFLQVTPLTSPLFCRKHKPQKWLRLSGNMKP